MSSSEFVYEYYLVGDKPVRIAYNQKRNPVKAETPGPNGDLVIDNMLMSKALLDPGSDKISQEDFEEILRDL